jgi:hypothetical protein
MTVLSDGFIVLLSRAGVSREVIPEALSAASKQPLAPGVAGPPKNVRHISLLNPCSYDLDADAGSFFRKALALYRYSAI